MYSRSSTVTIGEDHGAPRIYLQGLWISKAGFECGKNIRIDLETNLITIVPDDNGTKKVCGKRKNTIPVIDINCSELEYIFQDAQSVQVVAGNNEITITPAYTATLRAGRELAPTEASMFSGGGMLSLAAKLAGFDPKVAMEIDPKYADIFEHNHPTAHVYNASVSEVPYGELERFKPIGVMTCGIPCEPFSRIRRLNKGGQNKRDKDLVPECHPLGDMTFWTLRNIEALNPHTVIIEEVPPFLTSGAGQILINVLKRLYRHVESKLVNPIDYGSLTGRKRAVIIAQDKPIRWPAVSLEKRSLAEIMDPEPHEWFNKGTKSWLFNHWEKQTAKGNGFASQVYTGMSDHVGTIKKRYFAQQGDNPVVAHPNKEGVYRWLTLNEVKKLHGIPEDYYLGTSKTGAGEVIGQAVVVDVFQKIIESVTK